MLDFRRTLISKYYYFTFMKRRSSTALERAATTVLSQASGGRKRAKTRLYRSSFTGIQPGRISAARQRVIMSYASSVNIPNAAAAGAQDFRMNSLFDPDLTGAGAQPNGFDQWSAFYNRYVVYKFKIEGRIDAMTANTSTWVAHGPSNGVPLVTNANMLGNNVSKFTSVGGSGAPGMYFSNVIRLWKFTGKDFKQYMGDDVYSSLTTANPSEVLDYGVRAEAQGAAGVVTCHFMYRLTFWAEMFDPIVLVQS